MKKYKGLLCPVKDSKIPFDLLREVSAANIDLWCEYAINYEGRVGAAIFQTAHQENQCVL